MNTLILENDWSLDSQAKYFIKDNVDLFPEESINILNNLQERDNLEIIEALKSCDNLVVFSTFMHQDQVEDIVKLLVSPIITKKINFYVQYIGQSIEKWFFGKSWALHGIEDLEGFRNNIKLLFEKHNVFSPEVDYDKYEDMSITDPERLNYRLVSKYRYKAESVTFDQLYQEALNNK